MSLSSFIRTYHNPNSLYINEQEKWLWLRIHKTAGTSIYDAFLKDHCINIAKAGQSVHVTRWINNLTEDQIKQYNIFTFVRNPYDRFNSMAAMFKKEPNQFCKEFHYWRETNSVINRHTLPQHVFTHYNGIQVPKTIYRFETLQEDFDKLCYTLQLPQFELPKLNASRHAPWDEMLNEDTIRWINKHFKLDFEYFNYNMI